jgi:hypothetical protein
MNLLVKQRGLIQLENDFKLNNETMYYYGTNEFYMSQGFQWYIICNFWTYKSKDMIFQRSKQILVQISVLKSV